MEVTKEREKTIQRVEKLTAIGVLYSASLS
jgi:hypothetical protein